MAQDTPKEIYTYDLFVADASKKGFSVEPADFGGFKVGVYTRDHGSKSAYFSDERDMINFIASLYGVDIHFVKEA